MIGFYSYRSEMELKLVAACMSGDDSLVLSLINSGVNVNCLVKFGGREWSPLMMASDEGHTDIVKLLLQRGAQVDLQNNVGRTALMIASDEGHMNIAKLLMDHGAEVGRDQVLVAACKSGDDSLVLSLINSGVNVNCLVENFDDRLLSPLMMASAEGHTDIVKLLLQRGAQVDLQNNVGRTALMIASDEGHMNIAKLLMDHGAEVGRDQVLVAACKSGDDSLVLSLINSGVNVNCLVKFGYGEWSPLMRASAEGHTDIVKLLLQRGAQVDLQNDVGETALMRASVRGHMNIAKLLMDHGAEVGRDQVLVAACKSGDDSLVLSLINSGVNVNCLVKIDGREWSPLMMASGSGHTDIVKLLLQRGAQVDLQNNVGRTALMIASDRGHMNIAKLLMDHGAEVGRDQVLVAACKSGDDSLVLSLINSGVNVNCLVKFGYGEWSPLMMASAEGHTDIVKLLLQRGAQVDLQYDHGSTALMRASDRGHMNIAKLLMDHGAEVGRDQVLVEACESGDDSLVLSLINSGVNVNCLVKFGFGEWSPLMRASAEGHTDIVKLLLQRGAQVDLQNNVGQTALMWASDRGHMDIAKLLVDHGAEVGRDHVLVAACKSGDDSLVLSLINSGVNVNCLVDFFNGEWSPLMRASAEGHTEIVKVLLERGAQVDLQNNVGLTALMMASDSGCTEIVKVLLERGAQVDLPDNVGWTALMMASDSGCTDIVKLLLERGAQVDLQNNDGRTALMWASVRGPMDIAKLLVDHGAKVGRDRVLVAACKNGDDSLVLSLINSGVNVNCLVKFGYGELSPLMMASIEGHTDIVKLLLERGARVDLETNDGITAMNRARSYEIVDLLLSAMIPQLINLLQPVAHKWRELGEHLGLKETTLNQCYSSAKEEEGRLQAVMNTWSQQNDPRPTWRALIRAVKMVDRDLAQNMDQLVGKY